MAGLTLAVGAAGVSLLALVGYGAVKFCANTPLFNRITACFKKYFCCCLPNSNIRLSGNQNPSSDEEVILPTNPSSSQRKKTRVNSKSPQLPRSPSLPPLSPVPPHIPPSSQNTLPTALVNATPLQTAPKAPLFPVRLSVPEQPSGPALRTVRVAYISENNTTECDLDSLKERIKSAVGNNIHVEDCSSNPEIANIGIHFLQAIQRPSNASMLDPLKGMDHGAVVLYEICRDPTPHAATQYPRLNDELGPKRKSFVILFDRATGGKVHESYYNTSLIKTLTDMVEQSISH